MPHEDISDLLQDIGDETEDAKTLEGELAQANTRHRQKLTDLMGKLRAGETTGDSLLDYLIVVTEQIQSPLLEPLTAINQQLQERAGELVFVITSHMSREGCSGMGAGESGLYYVHNLTFMLGVLERSNPGFVLKYQSPGGAHWAIPVMRSIFRGARPERFWQPDSSDQLLIASTRFDGFDGLTDIMQLPEFDARDRLRGPIGRREGASHKPWMQIVVGDTAVRDWFGYVGQLDMLTEMLSALEYSPITPSLF